MNNLAYRSRATALLFGVVSVVGVCGFAQAQDKPHKSLIKRHPNASAAVAGVAAHHVAKHHGHGILHRHPVATGVAAAAVTHHMAKKSSNVARLCLLILGAGINVYPRP